MKNNDNAEWPNIDYAKYFDELKIGDLIVPDGDCFMLGSRWIVDKKLDNGDWHAHLYNMGISHDNNLSDMILGRGMPFECKCETLDGWRSKLESNKLKK